MSKNLKPKNHMHTAQPIPTIQVIGFPMLTKWRKRQKTHWKNLEKKKKGGGGGGGKKKKF